MLTQQVLALAAIPLRDCGVRLSLTPALLYKRPARIKRNADRSIEHAIFQDINEAVPSRCWSVRRIRLEGKSYSAIRLERQPKHASKSTRNNCGSSKTWRDSLQTVFLRGRTEQKTFFFLARRTWDNGSSPGWYVRHSRTQLLLRRYVNEGCYSDEENHDDKTYQDDG